MLYNEVTKKLSKINIMLNPQLLKRSIIIFAYVALFAAVVFGIYFLISPRATCSDNKKNQGEKAVDCGGPCSPCKTSIVGKDFVVTEKAFVSGGNNTYDAIVKISNPNDSVGASSFHYVFSLKDESGSVLSTKEGDDYILPADSKYIAQLGFEISSNNVTPSKIDFAVSDVKWEQLSAVEKPQLNVYDKKFGPDASGVGSRAEGLIRNESSNDFKKINVIVILRDEKGGVLGVNVTQEDNVRAKKEAGFVLTWPYAFPATVRSMEVDAQTNVFDVQNFSAGF